jgi:uncharacterized membrane protein YkoI
MNHTQILTAVLAATIATGAPVMAVAAYAQTPPTVAGTEKSQTATGEAAVLANAKITMAQAITAAELSAGGKSVGSGIENLDGTAFFEVEVLKNGVQQKVLVDTQSGQVVKTVTADNVQQDNEQNESGQENDQEDGGQGGNGQPNGR